MFEILVTALAPIAFNHSLCNQSQHMSTALPYNDIVMSNESCNLHDYLAVLVAAVTFLIGLILRPDLVYQFLKDYFKQVITIQESEPSFRISILGISSRLYSRAQNRSSEIRNYHVKWFDTKK